MSKNPYASAYSKRAASPDDLVGVVMRRSERDRLRELAASRGVTVPALLRTVLEGQTDGAQSADV